MPNPYMDRERMLQQSGQKFDRQQTPNKYSGADYGSAALMGVGDVLNGLFQLIQMGVGGAVQGAGKVAGGAVNELAKAPAGMGAAAGAFAGTPVGENPMGNMGEAIKTSANNPLLRGMQKGLSGLGEQMAMQKAFAAGPEAALQQYQGMEQQEQAKQAQQQPMQNPNGTQQLDQNQLQNSQSAGFSQGMGMQQNPPQTSPYGPSGFESAKQQALNMAMIGRPKQQGVISQEGLINKLGNVLFTPSGIDAQGNYTPATALGGMFKTSGADQLASQNAYNARPDQQKAMKTWENEQPLARSEREKLDIQGMNDFWKNIGESANKPLSAESSKLLGNVNSALKQITSLEDAFAKDKNVFKQWATPGNQTGESIKLMSEDIVDILGRLRSGGAISKDEEARFLRQLPKRGLFGNLENPKTVALKLKKLKELFSEIKSTVEPRDAGTQSRIQAALKAGATREQVYKVYREGGF